MPKIERFMSWRFGLFLHWGPCSVIGTELSWGRDNPFQPERLNQSPRDRGSTPRVRVPAALYDQLYKYFNPVHFDAERWVRTAKAAGMKYLVFTTKHHDGFCNFDTKTTDYKVTSPESPFGRDITRELADACHANDFGLGFYYSQPDWRHPDYGTERHADYIRYMHAQVEELCTKYGTVDIFFFDGLFDESKTQVSKTPTLYGQKDGADWWDAERLVARMRQWQPDMVINDRAGIAGDYKTPEQRVGAYMPDRPWESNVTITKRWSYGFDEQVKSTPECLRLLINSATGGGNFLLNVGPDPLGVLPPAAQDVLGHMGRWMAAYGESIYGTKGGPYPSWRWGGSTHRDNVVYLHVQHWPHFENRLRLPVPEGAKLVGAEALTGGGVDANIDGGLVHVTISTEHLQAVDTIVKLTFDKTLGLPGRGIEDDRVMRAVVCEAPGQLTAATRPGPMPPPPGWASVDIRFIGICGTDYHIYEGKHPFLAYPRVMGHELSGVVGAVGEGVTMPVGTAVIVNPYLSCGICVACRQGKPNCCTRIEVLGVHRDGGMCERISVPAGNLYPADGLSLAHAAAVEFLAIGAHAVRRSQARRGAHALVVGIGPIGLGTALFARIAGLEVTLTDASAERLEAARGLGFAQGVVAGPESRAALMALTGDDGFDVVFDATGLAVSIEAGFALVAHGGTYVLVSVVKDTISFADPEFHKREMTLVGSRNATREDFEHVVASMKSGAIPLDRIVTHRTTLEGVVRDLPRWAHDKAGLIKAVVEA